MSRARSKSTKSFYRDGFGIVERRQCFFNTIFVSSHMYPENPEGTQVIEGSMSMGYISDTARNRTPNLLRPKRESIPLGHSDGLSDMSDISSISVCH